MPTQRIRLDELLVRRGHFADTESAARAIYAGEVTSPKTDDLKPGTVVLYDIELSVKKSRDFVSRGGQKLAHALDVFAIDVTGLCCIDIGAGSGGFTDCLLQRGATAVTAVDVGYGQFDWSLRHDVRVTLMERTNFSRLVPPVPEEAFDLAVVDLSFTRSSGLLGLIKRFVKPHGQILILVKPQFELSESLQQSDGFVAGVVVDSALHVEVLNQFMAKVDEAAITPRGLIPSPIKGAEGNHEFLFWATLGGIPVNIDIQEVVSQI